MPGKQVKDWDTYHSLRNKGLSKKFAARVANARAGAYHLSTGKKLQSDEESEVKKFATKAWSARKKKQRFFGPGVEKLSDRKKIAKRLKKQEAKGYRPFVSKEKMKKRLHLPPERKRKSK